jgi:hypothetical protein
VILVDDRVANVEVGNLVAERIERGAAAGVLRTRSDDVGGGRNHQAGLGPAALEIDDHCEQRARFRLLDLAPAGDGARRFSGPAFEAAGQETDVAGRSSDHDPVAALPRFLRRRGRPAPDCALR